MPSPYFYPTYNNYQQMYPAQNQQLQNMQQLPQMYSGQMPQAQQTQQAQPQQIQNGGFISVRSRSEAQNYPIAPGNSVTFKDETAPFVYVKTMGFSQLDRPVFETFRLVKEDATQEAENTVNKSVANNNIDLSKYVTKGEFEPILARLEALEADRTQTKPKKKDEKDDE